MKFRIKEYRVLLYKTNDGLVSDIMIKFNIPLNTFKFEIGDSIEIYSNYKTNVIGNTIDMQFSHQISKIRFKLKLSLNKKNIYINDIDKFIPIFENELIDFFYIKSKNSNVFFGGNYYFGLEKIVVVIVDSKYKIYVRNNIIKKIYINNYQDKKWLHKELNLFLKFTEWLFNEKLTFEIIFTTKQDTYAFSTKNLISIFLELYINYRKSTFYLYICHEIIHQIIGNKIFFFGNEGYDFCEGLTEYINLIYLYERFGYKFYKNKIYKYKNLITNNTNLETNGYLKIILFLDSIFDPRIDKEKIKEFIFEINKNEKCNKTIFHQALIAAVRGEKNEYKNYYH